MRAARDLSDLLVTAEGKKRVVRQKKKKKKKGWLRSGERREKRGVGSSGTDRTALLITPGQRGGGESLVS